MIDIKARKSYFFFFLRIRGPPRSPFFPYTPLFRSLTVLDGWGYRAETKGTAIALARKPHYDRLIKDFPNTIIQTSGPAVGLPEGQMGNSEVGHMNIGAGRIVHMDITKIDLMIANKTLEQVPLFQKAM